MRIVWQIHVTCLYANTNSSLNGGEKLKKKEKKYCANIKNLVSMKLWGALREEMGTWNYLKRRLKKNTEEIKNTLKCLGNEIPRSKMSTARFKRELKKLEKSKKGQSFLLTTFQFLCWSTESITKPPKKWLQCRYQIIYITFHNNIYVYLVC